MHNVYNDNCGVSQKINAVVKRACGWYMGTNIHQIGTQYHCNNHIASCCNYRREHFQYRPTLLINVGLMSDDSDHLGKRPQNKIYFVVTNT